MGWDGKSWFGIGASDDGTLLPEDEWNRRRQLMHDRELIKLRECENCLHYKEKSDYWYKEYCKMEKTVVDFNKDIFEVYRKIIAHKDEQLKYFAEQAYRLGCTDGSS